MGNGLGKNTKEIFIKDINGNEIKRNGRLVKKFKYAKSRLNCKIKIAPRTYIYTEEF